MSQRHFGLRLVFTLALASVTTASLPGCATTSSTTGSKKELTSEEKARLLVQAAAGAINEGDPTGALQYLAEAEKIDSEIPELHYNRALAFYAKKDPKNALKSAKKALELSPKSSEINNTVGKLLIDAGFYHEAEAPLLKAASDPLYRGAYKANTNLAILYYRQGKLAKSNQHIEKAIQEAPELACVAYYYQGHLRLKESRLREAAESYDKATQKQCANFPDAHLALGIAFERNKQYDRARKKFLDIKNNFPNTKVAEQAMDRLKYLQ